MRKYAIVSLALLNLTNCAETRLNDEEAKVVSNYHLDSTSSLAQQSGYSRKLSEAYRQAAINSSHDQDIAAFITFGAALAVVGGAASGASNSALATNATIGSTSTLIAGRTLSKTTIKGIFTGAKRMNCIATTSNMGQFLLAETGANTKAAARAATYGAIAEVRILVREALVRDVADYGTIRDALTAEIAKDKNAQVAAGSERTADTPSFDLAALNQYLGLIDKCLGTAAEASAGGVIPQKAK